jgi:hypothetical protein
MNTLKKNLPFIILLIISICSFIAIVGISPLKTNNVNWLFTSNPDPLTHYLGWVFFRHDDWSFPVGLNPKYGLEIGSSIVFSDSIPLLAVFFKLLSPILTEPFQYFGIWYFACITLQGYFAWKLISLFSNDTWLKSFGVILAIFSPPMLWRIGIHAALVGHFLIISAFYLIFRPNKNHDALYWFILLASSALIQFYLFAMISALWLSSRLDVMWRQQKLLNAKSFVIILVTITSTVIVLWQAGYFFVAASSASEFGFGLYRMDFFSVFNPKNNYNGSIWSYFLKELPQSNHIYMDYKITLNEGVHEGFNYLGLGAIVAIPFTFFGLYKNKAQIRKYATRNAPLLLTLLALWVLSLSNNISFGESLLYIPLPSWLETILSIFRCSGRLFWPVFYAIIFCQIYIIIRSYPISVARGILAACCILQVLDTSAGWIPLQKHLKQQSSVKPENLFSNIFWSEATNKYSNIRVSPLVNAQFQQRWEHLATLAARNNLGTNAVYLARIDKIKLEQANNNFDVQLSTKSLNPETLYILDDSKILPALINIDPKKDLLAKIDNFVVLAPNWKSCKICSQSVNELEIKNTIQRIGLNQTISLDKANPNLKLILAGGHGWIETSNNRYINEDLEVKLLLPLPKDVSAKSLTISANIRASNNLPPFISFTTNGKAIEMTSHQIGMTTIFELGITENILKKGYIPLEIRTKNATIELVSAKFN